MTTSQPLPMCASRCVCVCVCVCARARACARACVCVCVHAWQKQVREHTALSSCTLISEVKLQLRAVACHVLCHRLLSSS